MGELKLSGYGLLFRGVHQVVQGTALGVVATLGISETAAADVPDPAMLQPPHPPLRQGAVSDRVPARAFDLPLDRKRALAAAKPRSTAKARTSKPRPVLESAGVDVPAAAVPAFDASSVPEAPYAGWLDAIASAPPAAAAIPVPEPAPAFALPLVPDAPLLSADAPAPAITGDLPFFVELDRDPGPAAPFDIMPFETQMGPSSAAAIALGFAGFDGDVSADAWLGGAGAKRQALANALLNRSTVGKAKKAKAAFAPPRPAAANITPTAAERDPFDGGIHPLLSTAPDRAGDDPASDAPSTDLDVGADNSGANGQAKEGDLLSLKTLSRGGLAVSGGYSSIEGPIASLKLSRTNIGAPGRDITLSGRYSKVQTLVEFGVSDSNFMRSKIAVSPGFFYSRSTAVGFDEEINSSLFVQTARGINVYLGRQLERGFRVAANYRFSDEDFLIRRKNALCDVGLHGNSFCNAIGRSTSSVLSLALSLDRRDNKVDPARGFQLRVTQDFAGPGGTTRYVRMRAGGTFYRRFSGNLDLSLGLEGGYMNGFDGRGVPLFDRFYVGGNTMRGFDLRGLGPKVIPTNAAPGQTTAIGGRAYYVGRLEVSMRLGGRIDKFGVSPSLFVDAGSVFGAQKNELLPGEILLGNSPKPRVAVGAGLAFNVAPGKLRFNIARPVVRQKGDRSQTFSITFGTAF